MYKNFSKDVILMGEQFEKEKEYWLNKLSGELIKCGFPCDYVKPKGDEKTKDVLKFRLPKELFVKLTKLSSGSEQRLHMILTAGVTLLLYKYIGEEDIIIGTPIYRQETEGEFINTILALRNRLSGDMCFRELILQVRQTIIEASENQNYPVEKLLNQLDIVLTSSSFPLLDVVVLLQNIHEKEYVSNINCGTVFSFLRTDEYIDGELEYNSQIYKRTTAERMVSHYINLMQVVFENLNLQIINMDMLSKKERKELLFDFNYTKSDYFSDKTVHELFEEQVEKTPENIAVELEDKELKYSELNRRANQLARLLRDKGVEPGCIAAIMAERSLDMIVGILGILKAGGAYLPIDPEYPEERIKYMLEDSGTKILLTQKQLVRDMGELLAHTNQGIIELDNERIYSGDGSNLKAVNKSDDLVYVIYTSGSTGKPKGVMVEHRSLLNFVSWRIESYKLKPEDITLQLISISFDGFGSNLYPVILSGGRAVMLENSKWRNFGHVKNVIRDKKVTNMSIVPSMYRAILENAEKEDLKTLRFVVLAGEKSDRELISMSGGMNPELTLINEYGPTENSITTAAFIGMTPDKSAVIGKPVSNNKVYILNKNSNLLPMGIPGELCVSGCGLARGYINNTILTLERFMPNPFIPDERMYRTGDLARWLPDGNLELLGRIDHQVKIRGFRIELGEIESCLLKQEMIGQAAVIARESAKGSQNLYAYVVCDEKLKVSQIREYLARELPEYMVPPYIIKLGKMPLTPNGKIDRKALPDLTGTVSQTGIVTGNGYELPESSTEKKLVELWKDLLEVERVGVNDNFFELGGQSLKAITLLSRIHKEFKVDIPLSEIFKLKNIKEIAVYIEHAGKDAYQSIEPAKTGEYGIPGVFPLSSAQKRMFIVNRFEGAEKGYNTPVVMRVEGPLEAGRVERAFKELVKRHECLRTSFEIMGSEPVQRIHEEVVLELNYREDEASCGSREERINIIAKEFIRPFDLSKAPLLRVGLVKIEEQQHLLMVDLHHIISDGVSLKVLLKEFTELYEGKTLPMLNIQYKDFSAWQNKLFKSKKIKKQEEHWLKVFSDEIPVLELHSDYPRPAVQSFEGDGLSFRLDKELTGKLNSLASENGATMYMVLLAAYNTLLYRYTGQEDIVVGSPVAGRPHADLENVVGMFVNTLTMRNYPQGPKGFVEFLKEVRENTLKAFENQDYQFEELLERLNTQRDMSRNPLFDTLFVLQDTDIKEMNIGAIKFTPYDFEYRTAKFDITLEAVERNGEIIFNLEYCTKLFNRETMQRFARHFTNTLGEIALNPMSKLAEIDMVSEVEKRQILNDFNNTLTSYPHSATIQELFEKQAEKTPHNAALVFEGKELTYSQLNKKANQLARTLQKRGIKCGSIVGLMAERSFEMVIGLLGILKAGGAYLPIEPEYPAHRLKLMLNDSGADILLVGKGQSTVYTEKPITVISLEDENSYCGDGSKLDIVNKPDDLAYVIYTSGSSGKPKGVMVEHRNVIRLVKNTNYIDFKEGDRILQTGALAFDASTFEIWGSLLNGLTLHLVDREVILDAEKLADALSKYKITTLWLTSPLFNQLSRQKPEIFSEVKNLLVGGDTLSPDHINRVRSTCKDLKIINGYGPTENTTFSTCFLIDKDYENIPIGKPISNSTTYIVDRCGRLQPIGVPGELWVGGAGVARGYLNRPELTSEKFIPNPFNNCSVDKQMLYRTGDTARWLPDGSLEFMGRMDNQVKIRGFRIELGEIESHLLGCEGVEGAAVISGEDTDGSKCLCAYVASDVQLNLSQLREHLSNSLPGYMIPSYFVQLKELPLTLNGKIDKKALPDWKDSGDNESIDTKHVEPQNIMEESLAKLWQDVLGIGKVGVTDNFFELGGHSLKATILASRIQKKFNVDIPLKEIFKGKTIRNMAEFIKESKAGTYSAIEPVTEEQDYPLSPAQKRLFVLDKLDGTGISYNMPMIMLVEGDLDVPHLEMAFKELLKRHEVLRTSFEFIAEEPVQKIHKAVDFQVSFAKHEGSENFAEDMDRLVEQFIRPFDLSKAPLVRVQLIQIEKRKHVFMLDMHHIISDGTSIGILIKELGSLYDGKTLRAQSVQYKDYSAWKQKQLDDEQAGFIKKQEKYWLDRFKKGTPVLELPLDYQRPSIQNFEGDRIDFKIDRELTEKLKAIASKNDATMYMVLLSIYTILLYKYSGQEDIVVGSGTAGRLHADIENTVGMFVNTLPMRNYPGGNKTFTEFLSEVKETALKAYENQDYQFEELVEKLGIKWNPGRNPIFDTTFILQNLNIPKIEMGNLKFVPYKFECNAAKFDITLEALEEDAQISFCLEYRTGLFKKETAQRMAGHLTAVAGEVAGNQEIPLSEIEILSKEERKQFLTMLKYHDGMISINDEELDSGNVAGVLTAEFNL